MRGLGAPPNPLSARPSAFILRQTQIRFVPTTILCGSVAMIAPEEKIAEARAKYGRTIEEILAKAPELDLYKILGAVEVLVSSKIYHKLPTTLAERMVFAFRWMAIEVNNGGFDQYFFNSAGDFWKDVFDGLQIIGDERGLASFREVLSIFPQASPSPDRFTRQEQLSALEEQDEKRYWDHFEKVSRRFWREPFPTWELVYDYVKTHTGEFDLRAA